MADKNEKSDKPAETPAKKGKSKTPLVVVVILLAEAGIIVGAMKFFGGPSEAHAEHVLPEAVAEEEKTIEIMVIEERLPNNRSGIHYLYETEIWVHVKKKHEAQVNDELNRFRNELKAEFMAIWRTAEPRHLQEPKMENLTRKVHALLTERFGNDPESGEPIVEKCVIVSGPGFRIDA